MSVIKMILLTYSTLLVGATMACPGVRLRWDLAETDIHQRTDDLITKAKAVFDAVGSLKAEEANYENVIQVSVPKRTKIIEPHFYRPQGNAFTNVY